MIKPSKEHLSLALIISLISFVLCGATSARADESAFFNIGGVVLPSEGLSADETMPLQDVRDVVQILRTEPDVRSIFKRWEYGDVKELHTVEEIAKEFLPEDATEEQKREAATEYNRKLNALANRLFGPRPDRGAIMSPRFTHIYVLSREVFGDLIVISNANGCVELQLDVDNPTRRDSISKLALYRFGQPDVVELEFDEKGAPRRYVATRYEPALKFYDLATRNDLQALAENARSGKLSDAVKESLADAKSIERKTLRVVEWNDDGKVERDERPEDEIEKVELTFGDDSEDVEKANEARRAELCDDTAEKCQRFVEFGDALASVENFRDFAKALDENATGVNYDSLGILGYGEICAFNSERAVRFGYRPKLVDKKYDDKLRIVEAFGVNLVGTQVSLSASLDQQERFKSVSVRELNQKFFPPAFVQSKLVDLNLSDPDQLRELEKELTKRAGRYSPLVELFFAEDGTVDIERRYIPYSDEKLNAAKRAPIFAFPQVKSTSGEGLTPYESYLLEALKAFTLELAQGATPEELATFAEFDPISAWSTSLRHRAFKRVLVGAERRLNFAFAYDDGATNPSEMAIFKGGLELRLKARDGKYCATVRYRGTQRVKNNDELTVEFDANGAPRALSYSRPKYLFDAPYPLAAFLATQYAESDFDKNPFPILCARFSSQMSEYLDALYALAFNSPSKIPVGRRLAWDENGALASAETFDVKADEFPLELYDYRISFFPTSTPTLKPRARVFKTSAIKPIFNSLKPFKLTSQELPAEDLAFVQTIVRLADVLRQPTDLPGLKAAIDQFPTNELFGADATAKGASEITLTYYADSFKRPAGLSYETALGRVSFDFEGDDVIVSTIARDGMQGATVMVRASGAIKELYVHRRARAPFESALDQIKAPNDDETTARKLEEMKTKIAPQLAKAAATTRMDSPDARFLVDPQTGWARDVVRHYLWTEGMRVGQEFWDKPARYSLRFAGTKEPSFTARLDDGSTYQIDYESGYSSEIRRMTTPAPLSRPNM